ncbi:MAG: alpha/beta hydrolase [Bryobacteraceae bacterium]
MRRIRIILILAAVLALAAGAALPDFVLRPPRRLLSESDLSSCTWDRTRPENVEIAAPGASLHGWYYPAPVSRGDAVILIHGVSDCRLGVASHARILWRHGYDVLLTDARAHGQSGGELATYGLLESGDVHRWADWLFTQKRTLRLYGLGVSMGAALLLQSMPVEPRFRAIAAESSFSTFREIAYDRVGQPFHLGDWFGRFLARPAVETAFVSASLRFGLDLTSISPEDAVAATRTPVFLIHPVNDRNIPLRHSRRIFARRRDHIQLWEVPGAGHTGALAANPAEYERRLLEWFAQ